MNLINKILILIILILTINYLSEGKITEIIKRYFTTCKINIENFMGITTSDKCITPTAPNIPYQSQKDFPYLNNNDYNNLDDESYDLYKFLNEMITPNVNNYELTNSSNKRIKASDDLYKEICTHIYNIFNCKKFKFNNIKFPTDIYYYKNPRGKDIEPFEFKADVNYKNKFIGSVIIYLECFIYSDKLYNKSLKSGYFSINNIKLLNRTYPDGINKKKVWNTLYKLDTDDNYFSLDNDNNDDNCNGNNDEPQNIGKAEKEAIEVNNKLTNQMVESFENHFVSRENYDDLFIKPAKTTKPTKHVTFQLDTTENSLIPSFIEFSP